MTVEQVRYRSVDALDFRTRGVAEHGKCYSFDSESLARCEQVGFDLAPTLAFSVLRIGVNRQQRAALVRNQDQLVLAVRVRLKQRLRDRPKLVPSRDARFVAILDDVVALPMGIL